MEILETHLDTVLGSLLQLAVLGAGWDGFLQVPASLSCVVNTSGFCNMHKSVLKSYDAKTCLRNLCKPMPLPGGSGFLSGSVRIQQGPKTS